MREMGPSDVAEWRSARNGPESETGCLGGGAPQPPEARKFWRFLTRQTHYLARISHARGRAQRHTHTGNPHSSISLPTTKEKQRPRQNHALENGLCGTRPPFPAASGKSTDTGAHNRPTRFIQHACPVWCGVHVYVRCAVVVGRVTAPSSRSSSRTRQELYL